MTTNKNSRRSRARAAAAASAVTAKAKTPKAETVKAETVKAETAEAETPNAETVKADLVLADQIQRIADNVEILHGEIAAVRALLSQAPREPEMTPKVEGTPAFVPQPWMIGRTA